MTNLLEECVSLWKTFDSRKQTIGAHLEKASAATAPIVEGTFRHKRILLIFVDSLMAKFASSTLREDRVHYLFLAYAVFFAKPGDASALKSWLSAAGKDRVPGALSLLQLALADAVAADDGEERRNILCDWVLSDWEKIIDRGFIQDKILGPMRTHREDYMQLLHAFTVQATIQANTQDDGFVVKKTKVVTVPVPFNLTAPKPAVEKIEEIPEPPRKMKITETLPPKLTAPPTVLEPFSLATDSRAAEKTEERAIFFQEVKNLEMRECTFAPKLSISSRDLLKNAREAETVRHTVTSILRQHAKLSLKQRKEFETLNRFLLELRDSSQFDAWRAEMDRQDALEEVRRLGKRKEEAKLARASAVAASVKTLHKNRRTALSLKSELDVAGTEAKLAIAENEAHQALANAELKKELVEARIAAEKKLAAVRAQDAEEIRRQKKEDEDLVKAKELAELELQRDLILQIRAFEKVAIARIKPFDPSEPPSHGLLDEMSLAELQERLFSLQAEREVKLDRKHNLMMEARYSANSALVQKIEEIGRVRNLAIEENKQRAAARQAREAAAAAEAAELHAECVRVAAKSLQDKLDAQELEEKRLEEISARLKEQRKDLSEALSRAQKVRWDQSLAAAEKKNHVAQQRTLLSRILTNQLN